MTGKEIKTRFDLWLNGIRVYVNGEEYNLYDTYIPTDDADIQIYHESYRNKSRSKFLKPTLNVVKHDKGIHKECKYYMIGFGAWHGKPSKTIMMPYHRLLYIWFYDDLKEKMDIGHIDCDSMNNSLSNLKQMTRSENLAMRTGAVNQYGLRKKDR